MHLQRVTRIKNEYRIINQAKYRLKSNSCSYEIFMGFEIMKNDKNLLEK